jgi:hypothetical protein
MRRAVAYAMPLPSIVATTAKLIVRKNSRIRAYMMHLLMKSNG